MSWNWKQIRKGTLSTLLTIGVVFVLGISSGVFVVGMGVVIDHGDCPDCPEPVVGDDEIRVDYGDLNSYVDGLHRRVYQQRDSINWLLATNEDMSRSASEWRNKYFSERVPVDIADETMASALADSIAVLNERLDWLAEEHFQLQGSSGLLPSKSISQSDLDEFAAKQRMLYCPDMVSFAAVDLLLYKEWLPPHDKREPYLCMLKYEWDSLKQARGL